MSRALKKLEALRPDLDLEHRLMAHTGWALETCRSVERGEGPLDYDEFVKGWSMPRHPLEKLFTKAIDNGHRVTVSDEGRAVSFNHGDGS